MERMGAEAAGLAEQPPGRGRLVRTFHPEGTPQWPVPHWEVRFEKMDPD
jgi:hypothetical protein